MKYTKEMWGRLLPEERCWLGYYHKHCNEWGVMGAGGYLPEDSSECVICDQPQMGSGVCMACLKEADRLYKIMGE